MFVNSEFQGSFKSFGKKMNGEGFLKVLRTKEQMRKCDNKLGTFWDELYSEGVTFTPPKFNIAPEKWWLEDEFPFGIAYFQVSC